MKRYLAPTRLKFIACWLGCCLSLQSYAAEPVRVFIFAGQSNMVGSDSKLQDVSKFPPFAGLEKPQPGVRFSYLLGRKQKTSSQGWTALQAVNNVVGPELSFARRVSKHVDAPIAIIKCAAGGTHLGGDWNPDQPEGFKMYPLALQLVRSSLAEFDRRGIKYRLEGLMWHQGENDMFNEQYMSSYGANLKNFLARWRRDLKQPKLKFYIGELCTKTIWGMDLRPRMYAISKGQRFVTDSDPFAEYVPTSHIGVEIGGGVGLHYHYGTLGQLEHGVNYADAYLRTLDAAPKEKPRRLSSWPYAKGRTVRLFVLAGHRNMEGERAFIQELVGPLAMLRRDNQRVAFRFSIGGGIKTSDGWEPLGPAGYYDTFGPELAFGQSLQQADLQDFAIAKFTHSGSQMNDWTPQGSVAKSRNLYPQFVDFVKKSVASLEGKGHPVVLEGVFYHVGENDMSMPPYRKKAAQWLQSTIAQSRIDLGMPSLKWYVSQQRPTDHQRVNSIDITFALESLSENDENMIHIKVFDAPPQPKQLVLNTEGIVYLGERLAAAYLRQRATK